MLLALEIEQGYSLDCIMVDNVVDYHNLDDDGTYMITYDVPNSNELVDLIIKHVSKVKEVA